MNYEELQELWEQGRLADSRRRLEEARPPVVDEPAYKLAMAQQLVLEDRSGADQEAVAAARSLVQEAVAPDQVGPELLVKAIVLAFDLGDHKAASAYVRRIRPTIRELYADDTAALAHVVGSLLLRAGEADEAERQLRLAVDNDPAMPLYALALATKLLDEGRRDAARDVVAGALRHRPREPDLLRLRARLDSQEAEAGER